MRKLNRLYGYAFLNRDTDMGIPAAQELFGRAALLAQKAGEAASFIAPELARAGEAAVNGYIADPDFRDYTTFLKQIRKPSGLTRCAHMTCTPRSPTRRARA